MLRRLLILVAALLAAIPATAQTGDGLREIERRSGGRLGVSLIEAGEERDWFAQRGDERFAMCSTFKLPLAAMLLGSGVSQRTPLPFTRAELLPNSPRSAELLGSRDRGEWRAGFASQAIVEQSDNTAANLLLRRLGGPAAFTAWARRMGDPVTRLDRYEPALNENARGDERDTTSPAAMARLTARIIFGDMLHVAHRRNLRRWTFNSETGVRRIRAGLPQRWLTGDKTGTCGTAYADVAWFTTPSGRNFVLAIYLDRPTVRGEQAKALIADAARQVAGLVN